MPTKRLIMVKDCGHRRDVTTWPGNLPAVGEKTTCYSMCDGVPFWNGRDEDNPRLPRVRRYEERDDHPEV
jgi:hypothetical protein